jgi:SAM-dependent methyltransferase
MSYIPNTETRVTTGDYLFPNSDPETPARFAALSELFDEVSIHHLSKLGVRTGWHCLEVGAGSGSIAKWLADRVGPGGHVLATDIDPSFLRCMKSPNVEVRQHNIAVDALPEATFDLVHSRLVLHHVPQRDEALQRMIFRFETRRLDIGGGSRQCVNAAGSCYQCRRNRPKDTIGSVENTR